MSRLDELVSEQFSRWELRGRGWQVWPYPVTPEPPYMPFAGYSLPEPNPANDDGRKAGLLASIFDSWEKKLNPQPPPLPLPEEEPEPEPEQLTREEIVELHTILPANLDIKTENFAAFLQQLAVCREPVAFELFGEPDRIAAQFAVNRRDVPVVRRQLTAYFPETAFLAEERTLASAWTENEGETAIVEFGLDKEFMLPLATGSKPDPFLGLIGAMSELEPEELALFQVLFQPVHQHWMESAWTALTGGQSKGVFVNRPDLTIGAQDKFASRLYGVVLRIATKAPDFDRAWQLARELAFPLHTFANLKGNAFIPLHNEEYPFEAHNEDVIRRQSRRSGMLLNVDELTGLVHFPSAAVRSEKLRRQIDRTKAAPVLAGATLHLGENRHLGNTMAVGLLEEQRFRHVHVIGATGTGKSTLLFNLIRQDIESHRGVAVLDPHGDLIDRILGIISENRQDEVIVFDPSDPEFTVGFNLLSAHSEAEKALLASDLVSVFERHSTSWGDQLNSVLRNAVHAFLESSRGGTLLDLRRFLIEPGFRAEFLTTVNDSEVLYYWHKAFPQLTGTKSLGPILTRLDTFLSPKPVRHALAVQDAKLDFAKVMDSGKIFLAKLPQGQIGKENSFLLGSLLVGKFQQLAMARQGMAESLRRPYYLYIDEFHQFMTPSMVEILNGARKYRLGLTLAHQELRQLSADKDVESAVLSNAGTRIVFRVGDADARQLAEGFSYFESADVANLNTGQAIGRIERSEQDFNLSITSSTLPSGTETNHIRETVITHSREQFATSRVEIEALLRQQLVVAPKPTRPAAPISIPPSVAPIPAESPSLIVAEVPPPQVAKIRPEPFVEPRPTVVEPPVAPPKETSTTDSEEKRVPVMMGRGGPQHQDIQQHLREAAQALGFHVTVEKPTPDKQGSIDLALESGRQSIACEITVTTPIAHEVENARKCLEAGYQHVVLISIEEARLEKLKQATKSLAVAHPNRLQYFTPEQFLAWLSTSPVRVTATKLPSGERNVRGYKVRSKDSILTDEERQAKESAALKVISDAIKPKRSRVK